MSQLQPVFPKSDSDAKAVYITKDVVLVLHSLPDGLDLSDYGLFAPESCLIFAEKVIISKDTIIRGKTITICCTDFVVKSEEPVKLSISGDDGLPLLDEEGKNLPPAPKSSAALDGRPGGTSGSLNLLVRNGLDSVLASNRLTIDANGGNGSGGQQSSDPAWPGVWPAYGDDRFYPRGGKGADGGNGGSINLYYHASEAALMTRLNGILQDTTVKWKSKIEKFDALQTDFKAADLCLIPDSATTLATFATSISAYLEFSATFTAALSVTERIINFIPLASYPKVQPPSPALVGAASMIKALFVNVLDGSDLPDFVLATLIKVGKEFCKVYTDWLSGVAAESILQGKLQEVFAIQLNAPAHANGGVHFSPAYQAVITLLTVSLSTKSQKLTGMCSAQKGKGSPGGNNTNWEPGDFVGTTIDGKDGNDGSISATHYDFSDGEMLQACPIAYAFPEQCQMMLDTADRFFCSAKAADRQIAAMSYADLLSRLAFFPSIWNESEDLKKAPRATSPLLSAYTAFENPQNLTIGALDSLKTVYDTAKLRINVLSLGCDMFGNAANWVPRLSPTFYQKLVEKQIKELESLETLVDKLGDTGKEQAEREAKITDGINASMTAKSNAETELDILLSKTGSFAIASHNIPLLTIYLHSFREEVQQAMAVVQKDIEAHWDIRVEDIYNAICSLVQSKDDPLTVIKTLGEFGYHAKTTITDEEGGNIKKEYLIKKLVAFSGNVNDLDLAFKSAQDNTIVESDVGAVKILATKESIESLVQQYTGSIPEAHRADLSGRLERLLQAALERNDAIVKYNAGVQEYIQTLNNRDTAIAQSETWGTKRVTLDPTLPSIYYALNRVRRNMQLDILRNLSYEGRALAFWAVKPFDQIPRTLPSPLKGSKDLAQYQTEMGSAFTACLTEWANRTWSYWPANENNSQAGLIYKLTDDELKQLLTPSPSTSDKAKRTFQTKVSFLTDTGFFAGSANVRIRQIRVWLMNAKCSPDHLGRELLKVSIQHGSVETLRKILDAGIVFLHDPVEATWQYDAALVKKVADITNPKATFVYQVFEKVYQKGEPDDDTKAAIGPFATWSIEVDEANNPGLDLIDVKEAYIEFWGREDGILSKTKAPGL